MDRTNDDDQEPALAASTELAQGNPLTLNAKAQSRVGRNTHHAQCPPCQACRAHVYRRTVMPTACMGMPPPTTQHG